MSFAVGHQKNKINSENTEHCFLDLKGIRTMQLNYYSIRKTPLGRHQICLT